MPESPMLKVCFLTQDTGLAEAIARALGDGFEVRGNSEFAVRATWRHVSVGSRYPDRPSNERTRGSRRERHYG